MFEFSVWNGKSQFKQGLIGLVICVLVGALFGLLLAVVKSDGGRLAVVIIFSIVLIVLGLLTTIKLIFGAVVYHAETIAFSRFEFEEEMKKLSKRKSSKKEK